jgi:hypothetical protein
MRRCKRSLLKIGVLFLLGLIVASASTGVHASSTWTTQHVDENGVSGLLAVNSFGNPHILYNHWSLTENESVYYSSSLIYAIWDGSKWVSQTIDPSGGDGSAILLDSSDRPHVFYEGTDGTLKYATIKNEKWSIEKIDSAGSFNHAFSMALDSQGNPHVIYSTTENNTNYLKYAFTDGSNWSINTIAYWNGAYENYT